MCINVLSAVTSYNGELPLYMEQDIGFALSVVILAQLRISATY